MSHAIYRNISGNKKAYILVGEHHAKPEHMLRECGVDCRMTTSIKEFIKAVREEPPDLIILNKIGMKKLDWRSYQMNNPQTVQSKTSIIRKHAPNIIMVALDNENQEAYFKAPPVSKSCVFSSEYVIFMPKWLCFSR